MIIKKFFNSSFKLAAVLTASMFICVVAYAATRSSTKYSAANQIATLVTNGCTSIDFTIINTNAALSSTVTFFDAPVGTNQYAIGAYSNVVSTLNTITNVWTNYYGVVQSNVFTALVDTLTAVDASTNYFPVVYSGVFGSNSSTKITLSTRFFNGITFTNSASVSVIGNYVQ